LINDQTLLKNNRLLKPSEFQNIYKSGQWVANRELVVNFKPKNTQLPKLGITVSKKVSKRAVDRNRIKRQIREWFRKNKSTYATFDLIITAKPVANSKTNQEIQYSLEDIWRKVQKKY